MPGFKVKNFVLYEPKAYHYNLWAMKVVESAIKVAQQEQRAVVLVASSMREAKFFYKTLREHYEANLLRLYTDDREDNHVIKSDLEVGEILVSTSAIGRGIDLGTTGELNEHGGLHILLTYLPDNERVEWQVYGRTARSGNPGTAQMIINYEHVIAKLKFYHPDYLFYGVESFQDILNWRNEVEEIRLEQDKQCGVPMLLLKDKLFSEYRKFFAEHSNLNAMEYNPVIEQLNEAWGIWLKDKELLMACNTDEPKDIEATENILLAELEKFFAKSRDRIEANKFIKNPTYQTLAGFDHEKHSELEHAVNLDPDFAFPSLYLKATLEVRKHLKSESLATLEAALTNLQNITIPPLWLYSRNGWCCS